MVKIFRLLVVVLFCGLLSAQEPGPLPIIDNHYICTSPTGPTFTMNYKKYPNEIQTEVVQPIGSTDAVVPVVRSVSAVSGFSSQDVSNNKRTFSASTHGVAFTIAAFDDVGIVSASLYVNGTIATTTNRKPSLPLQFDMRWNADSLAIGAYNFTLLVWDAAGNVTQRSWIMTLT